MDRSSIEAESAKPIGRSLPETSILTKQPQLRRNLSAFWRHLVTVKERENAVSTEAKGGEKMTRVHRIAGLRISRVEPTLLNRSDPLDDFWTPKDALPELEPAEDRLRKSKRYIFASDTITLSHSSAMDDVFDPARRAEAKSRVASATVYVMNMIVLVMALPVGLGLLLFNILFGENLRTTAHVIALTGMALALSQTPEGARIFGFL